MSSFSNQTDATTMRMSSLVNQSEQFFYEGDACETRHVDQSEDIYETLYRDGSGPDETSVPRNIDLGVPEDTSGPKQDSGLSLRCKQWLIFFVVAFVVCSAVGVGTYVAIHSTQLTDQGYTKIIIATGLGDRNSLSSVEVIDTSDSNTVCSDLPPYHKATYGATGGLIGNTPLICGGGDDVTEDDTCYALVKNNWQLVTSMTADRYYSASAVLGNSLMVTGGVSYLDSSDLVGLDSSKPGPTLPRGVEYHCSVSLNDSTIMIIGGWYQDLPRTTTYYYHLDIDHWTKGPDLNTGRYAHSCGTIKSSDQVTVVAVGGLREDSVEVLRLGSSEWSYGTPLPLKIGWSQLVPDATGKGVLLIGGQDANYNVLNSIYHMACVGCDWVKMAQSLKIARYLHVAIPVHDDLVTCE